jgi:hypothetical protein
MYCSNCGTQNTDGAAYCVNCATPLNGGTGAAPVGGKSKLVAGLLEPLAGQIPGLLNAQVRPCFQGGMDFCLYSELESREALAVYADHPLHIAAKDQFFHMLAGRVAIDFEV